MQKETSKPNTNIKAFIDAAIGLVFKKLSFVIVFINLCWLVSCTPKPHRKDEIESAMRQYDRLIQKMDTDSIALLYTEDGDMGNVAHGRGAIRKFLATFKDFKVISQYSISKSVNITGDSSLQKGTYQQTVITPTKDTLIVKGEYKTTWLWMRDNSWHIKHMETKTL